MLTFALAAMLAQASVLDRPIAPQPPTIRTEVDRGYAAAERCSGIYGIDPDGLERCILAAGDVAKQETGTNFEAFSAGLFHHGAMLEEILLSVKTKSGHDALELAGIRAHAQRLRALSNQYIEQLHLSGRDLVLARLAT